MKTVGRAVVFVAVLAAACSSHDEPHAQQDPARPKRVIEPPSGKLRPMPPHAIRSDGVGPYLLGASLAELLDQLPSGPRIATLDIPGVVHRSILRAEDDTILIGGEPLGKATFVAVVGGEIARTERGLHVGSTRSEIARALGAPLEQRDRARDPRVVVSSGLPDARVVLDGDRVSAIVVLADDHGAPATGEGCTRPSVDEHKADGHDAGSAGSAGEGRRAVVGSCMTSSGELVSSDGDELVVRPLESDKPILKRIPGLVFTAPVRAADGRDDLIAIGRIDDPQQQIWTFYAFRLDGLRLVAVADPTPVYQLTAATARWVGAELKDLDLYLEVKSHPETFEVGGLLTTRAGDRLRDVVVISPVSVPRHRVRPAPAEPTDAGVSDAAR